MNVVRYLPRFTQARAALSQSAAREALPRHQIESYQLDSINRIWAAARLNVPYYREMEGRHDVPDRFESLAEFSSRMPLLDKSVVRDHPDRFLSSNPRHGRWHRTGGSTGVPMRVYWEKQSHLENLQSKYRMLQQWNIDIFDSSVFLWGHSGSIAPGIAGLKQRIRRPIEDALRNRLRLSAYRLGPKELDRHLEAMQRYSPASVYGYSCAVSLLAQRARETGIQIPSLRLVILTAEPADGSMIEQVSADLGCDASIEYGSVECGVMATSFPDGSLRIREDSVFVETIGNDLGSYDLIVTVLRNASFPLMRYRIEDVTSKPITFPEFGFGQLSEVMGRENDLLVSKDGTTLHSMAVKHVLERYTAIRRFCAHQLASGELHVTIETFESADVLPVDRLRDRLEQTLGGYPVKIDLTDRLKGNLAGKHRWVLSDLVKGQATG